VVRLAKGNFILIYSVGHNKLPENKRHNNNRVVQQKITSCVSDDSEDNRTQAIRQACGFANKKGIIIFPDETGFTVEFIRSEIRIDGRRKSKIVAAKRKKQEAKKAPEQTKKPKPKQMALTI